MVRQRGTNRVFRSLRLFGCPRRQRAGDRTHLQQECDRAIEFADGHVRIVRNDLNLGYPAAPST